jgi:hypothetical protein
MSWATLFRICDLHWMDGLGQRAYRSWIMQFVYTTILLSLQQLMAFWSDETTVTQFKYIPLPSTYKADVVPFGTFKYVLYNFYIFTIYWKTMSVWDLRLPQSWCCRFAYSGILHFSNGIYLPAFLRIIMPSYLGSSNSGKLLKFRQIILSSSSWSSNLRRCLNL